MKNHVEKLISLGWSKDEALQFVKSIAYNAFEVGAENVDYSDEGGFFRIETFDEWFKGELK
jgi:hypothetical protein